MSHLLLIGAGFTRNWGAPLSNEVHNALFGELRDNAELHEILRRAGSFEEALGQVQADYKLQPSIATKGRLDHLQGAILRVFGRMNDALAARLGMEFGNTRQFSILRFLAQFDAIFSLNQDLLFELHYNIALQGPAHPNGHHFPGMHPPANWQGQTHPGGLADVWRPMQGFELERNTQPIFKLHGSVNWRDRDGGELLVMGTNKPATIAQKRILSWYREQFREYLEQRDTRLMVAGYGFRDVHINEELLRASNAGQLRMFLVHPQGRGILNPDRGAVIRARNPLEDIALLGVSERPITSTFRDDEYENGELWNFLRDD